MNIRRQRCIRAASLFFVYALIVPAVRADLVLSVDPLGNASIVNTGAAPVDFDGYTIRCELLSGEGCALPVSWFSIEDQVAADPLDVIARLGPGALGFSEANPTDKQLTELTLGAGAVLQPGDILALGQPILPTSDLSSLIANGELSWEWTSATFGSTPNGTIAAVPEPSAALFSCIGILPLAIRRYFNCRQI